MASIAIFHDLPPAETKHGHEHRNPTHGDRLGTQWYAMDQDVTKTLDTFGIETAMAPWRNTRVLGPPRDPQVEHSHSFSCEAIRWDRGLSRSSFGFNDIRVHKPWEHSKPWPSALVMPGHVSPPLSCADDRSASEQGSCSTWTPEPSECRPESDDENARFEGDYATDYIPAPVYQPHDLESSRLQYSVGSAELSSLCSPRSISGITLRQIQQYPDTCTEDGFQKITQLAMGSEHPYYLGHPRISNVPTRIESPGQPSNHQDADSNPNARGSPLRANEHRMTDRGHANHADEDSGSDYSPSTHRLRGPRRRESRAVSIAKSPKSTIFPKHRSSRTDCGTNRGSRINKIIKSPARRPCTVSASAGAEPPQITCSHCELSQTTQSALNKHITTIHTRPFTCTFQFYGCSATFGSKNEWKRHVSSQHLRLGIWRCDLGACVPPSQQGHEPTNKELIYNDFNRKDLFTQHLRRMHGPHKSSAKTEQDAFNASLESASRRCLVDIRQPPPYTICGYCNDETFQGPGAWEQRMEHIGRHLENGHGETKEWREDLGLKEWMVVEGLVERREYGAWRLVGLKEEENKGKKSKSKDTSSNDD